MEEVKLNGKYIYCIIASKNPETFGPLGIGDNGDVYTIGFKDIAAVVSNSPCKNYSISRENMLAHEKAIEKVMQEYSVLPVRFGTIADDETRVKRILEKEYDRFIELFKTMEGKIELGLKALLKKEVIYKEILEKYENIRKLKETIETLPPEKSHYLRVEVGQMVEDALQKEKEECKVEITANLSPLAEDTKINNNYGELMIVNAAFLVAKAKETIFDEKVRDLGEKYKEKIKFKYVGTVPPANFVNLMINTEE